MDSHREEGVVMKVWYARLVNDNSGTHYVVDTIKSKVFQACKELIESGDYYCDDGDVIIEHQYFSLRRSTVLDAMQLGADLAGNSDAILWKATKVENNIEEREKLLALYKAKIEALEQGLAMVKE
tara:strand:- start:937 stop:1311 length:375 start_codon:yes stop_codon:yes gene_type:complete